MTPLKRVEVGSEYCKVYIGSYTMGYPYMGIVHCTYKKSALGLIIDREFKE
jgi:hypothetical protein